MSIRPICFMVMPFSIKPTQAPAGRSAPDTVDFDHLWREAHQKAITDLGYDAVRADEDLGASIIQEMIERLAVSDLVVADISIPNANVYYEIGVRHAAKATGCVLISADWAAPLFDISQMRQVRYTLRSATVDADEAYLIRQQLKEGIANAANGLSPIHHAVPGFPNDIDLARLSTFRSTLHQLSEFQAEVSAVRRVPSDERRRLALDLRSRYHNGPSVQQVVALELLSLLRDCTDWETVLAFTKSLPEPVARLPYVREQRALAQSKTGDYHGAIVALEALISDAGETSERRGLIGGNYKRLMGSSSDPAKTKHYLSHAIEHYERGMYLDLNDYFPSSNLARLYRQRGRKGDAEKAVVAASVTEVACARARRRHASDPWLKPTLLAAAFDAGDVDTARELADDVEREGAAIWRLETALADIERSIAFFKDDPERFESLASVVDDLRTLLAPRRDPKFQ